MSNRDSSEAHTAQIKNKVDSVFYCFTTFHQRGFNVVSFVFIYADHKRCVAVVAASLLQVLEGL